MYSSCSPDFGVVGVSDRLGQISPKLVFFSLGYFYGGKWHDCRKLAADVVTALPGEYMLQPFIAKTIDCFVRKYYGQYISMLIWR